MKLIKQHIGFYFTIYLALVSLITSFNANAQSIKDSIASLEDTKDYKKLVRLLEEKLYVETVSDELEDYFTLKLLSAYKENRDYENLISLAIKTIENHSTQIDTVLTATYFFYGTSLRRIKDYDAAIEVTQKGIDASRAINDTIHLYKNLLNNALVLNKKSWFESDTIIKLKIINEAKACINETEAILDKLQFKNINLSSAYNTIALTYFNMGKKDIAVIYHKKTIKEEKKHKPDNDDGICLYYNNLAATLNLSVEYEDALVYLDSIKLYNWDKLSSTTRTYIYVNYYWLNLNLHNLKSAEAYLDSFTALKEKIITDRFEKELNESALLYKKEKTTRTKQQNEKSRAYWFQNLILFLIVMGILALITSLIYFTLIERKRHKLVKNKVITQQRLLRTQINPTFIYDSINNTQEFLKINDSVKAIKTLDTFSGFVRTTLDNSTKKLVTLESEIEALKAYVALKQEQQSINFMLQQNIEEFDFEDLKIPPMLLQPFVENAINLSNTNELSLQVILNLNGNNVHCVVESNNSSNTDRANLKTLSNEIRKLAQVRITNKLSTGESGTVVKLIIPAV